MSRRFLAPFVLVAWALTPSGAAAQADAADSAWLRGDRASAQRLYAGRLGSDSTDATALYRLAMLAGWQGRRSEGIALLDRLLLLWPADNDARLARARMLSAMGRQGEAEATVDTVLRMEPASIGGLQLRARFVAFEGDFIESERLWRAVLGAEPGNVETRVGLSQVLRWQGRVDAAAGILEPARDRDDPDLRDELDRVHDLTQPRAGSRAVYEEDNDGNAISTLALHAATRAAPGTDLRADAWLRSASLGEARAISTRGGTLTLVTRFEPGWTAQAGAGVSTVDGADLDATVGWSLAVGSPRRHRWAATISASRVAHDYTAPMAVNGIRADLVELAVSGRPARDWTVDAAASTGRFLSRRSGVGNGRVAAHVAVAHAVTGAWTLGFQTRGFGFEKDAEDGYFDPDLYGLAALELRWHRDAPHWAATATAVPGLQQVGTQGTPGGAFQAEAALDLIARPGRSVGIRAVWANTGVQQLSMRPAGSYRYASIGLDIRWRFR